ncbi:glutathione transferase GST 23-like [Canna indica]|uniref:glutathione transferase n=1 Tax=Canna indica TaxID=4628 RepID=A0AAQ3QRM9_9LILI|nr:glutathione transferase GST 23-like [Canna indica]
MQDQEVKLLGTWSSPYVLRIRWALRIKGIEYEYIEEDLRNKSPLLLEYNPVHKKVPVLVHKGRAIAESLVILEYIDETWRDNPLLPRDPYDKAMARFWCKFGEEKLSPPIWRVFVTQGEEQKQAYASAMENLEILEKELEGKRFLSGEAIGLLDIFFGSLAYIIPMYEEIIEMKLVDPSKLPWLSKWMEEFLNSPVVKDTLPQKDKLLPRYLAIRDTFLAKRE